MSEYPPPGPPGHPPYGYWPPPPHHHPPHHHPPNYHPPHHYPPLQPHAYPPGPPPPPYPYFVPGVMFSSIPVPVAQESESNPTYITNYNIYQGEPPTTTAQVPSIEQGDQVQVVELSGEYDWVPTTATTASHLTGRACVGGHEGWDGSPLWVIRAWHNGDLIPGKFSVRHNSATIVYDGKEVPVQNIEVLTAKPESLRWIPASNGSVPPSAIPGGRTSSGETLYVGRARHQLSITPGKVHPSHNTCYIAFAGAEVSHKVYDVLCRIS